MEPYRQQSQQSKVLKWAVIIAIVIVLNLFFNYALSLVYSSPDYQKFCPDEQVNNTYATRDACLAVGGQWNETVVPQEQPASTTTTTSAASKPAVVSKPIQDINAYCNPTYTCQKNYDNAEKSYEKNVFITLIVLGVLSIIVGMFVRTTETVSIGLSFGGVLSLIIASIRYWSEAQNLLKVCILAIALIALIWVGMKRFKE